MLFGFIFQFVSGLSPLQVPGNQQILAAEGRAVCVHAQFMLRSRAPSMLCALNNSFSFVGGGVLFPSMLSVCLLFKVL